MSKLKVIICLPAYKAERTLAKTVAKIPKGIADELILVDDASPDNTVLEAQKLGLNPIIHKSNKGYGGNQKTCYDYALAAGGEIIVLLHPDYQYDPKTISALIKPLQEGRADFTFGSRFAKRGNPLKGGMPLHRFLGNRMTTSLENLFLGTRFSELHSGLKAYTQKFLKSIPYHQYSDQFVFDSQMLIDAVLKGFKIEEVPIPTKYTDESSSAGFFDCLIYILQTFSVLLKKKWARFFDKLWFYRAQRFTNLFLDKIKPGGKVIDIGAGDCFIAKLVQEKGADVFACDIVDYNKTNLPLTLYNGKKLPFDNQSFDTALLISVLHHSQNPLLTLSEAKRISKKIILIEDTYENRWDKFWLKFNDFIFNVPFGKDSGQNFQTDSKWKEIFQKQGLKLEEERKTRSGLGIVKMKIYFLKTC